VRSTAKKNFLGGGKFNNDSNKAQL